MSKKDTLAILLPYAFKRALSSYSNRSRAWCSRSTSLAYTITLMEVMGHGRVLLYGRTYDVMVFRSGGNWTPWWLTVC
jgi:arginine transport system permease protein